MYHEAEQLEAWIMGSVPRTSTATIANKEVTDVGRIKRWVVFLRNIWSCVKTDEMRTNACSDLFWYNEEYRKAVLLGVIHMTVYVRENSLHLIQRICIQA